MASIIYASNFVKQFEKLPQSIQEVAYKKIAVFQKNQKDKSLKVHKLSGILKGYMSFSVDHKIRIVFEYINPNLISFSKIGNHDIYK